MGHSTMVVKGDRVYTAGYNKIAIGGETAYEEVIYCIEANSGRVIWRYSYPTEHQDFPGPGATPLLDGDDLYMVSRTGDVLRLDAASGRVSWKKNLVTAGLAQTPSWGFCSSPVAEGDMLILNAGASGVALDKRTGKVIWASAPERGGLTTPALVEIKGKKLAVIGGTGNLYGVDAGTGEVRWTFEWRSDADPSIIGTQIYLKGGFRRQGNLLLELKSGQPEVVWESRDMQNMFQPSVILDGHAYGFGRIRGKYRFTCIELASGEVRWSEGLGQFGSLMAASGKLIIIDEDGDLIIADADPSAYKVVASGKAIDMKHTRGGDGDELNACWSAPVLANGKVYARSSHGDLTCIEMTLAAEQKS
jgi:outer membrane protein assembly factor BamB